jgi:KDO2-lipid IV(A) lauroyltransferase
VSDNHADEKQQVIDAALKKMIKKIQHRIEYILFLGVGFVIRLLPLSALRPAAAHLIGVLYPFLKNRRNVAMRNLLNAYPEKTREELEKIVRGAFQSVAAAFFELLWMRRFTRDTLKRFVVVENPEFLNSTIKSGKGCVLLTAHFGNWELGMQATQINIDIPFTVIEKTQANSLIHKSIHAYREKFGAVTLPMESSIREILKTLHAGGVVGLAADQAAAKESVGADFFGRVVPTFQGPAAFSLKTGAPILLGFAVRQTDGTYRVRFEKVPFEDLKGASEENIAELTQRHTKMTEEIIRKYPDQWMWMHKRWKHVPDRVPILL